MEVVWPFGFSLQEADPNHLKLLRPKGVVVSVQGKVINRWQVCSGKMSESEPLMTYRKELVAVKTRESSSSGISLRETCSLRRRQSVYRRHDSGTGYSMERENLCIDVKGKSPNGRTP